MGVSGRTEGQEWEGRTADCRWALTYLSVACDQGNTSYVSETRGFSEVQILHIWKP